jgi:hypothetical protein
VRYWKPAGPGAFEFGERRVQKDWATGLWDIYLAGQLVQQNLADAATAIEESERLMV